MNQRGDRFKASQGGGLQQVVELQSSFLQDAVGVLKAYAGSKRVGKLKKEIQATKYAEITSNSGTSCYLETGKKYHVLMCFAWY